MVAVKGHSKYVWDYENGDPAENIYGQYLSHGMLTIFAQGDPIDDLSSGYRLDEGWDWYRMPGTTAVHFPLVPQTALAHRRFSSETFLGAATCDETNGVWGMILNQPEFADGSRIDLTARKSAFFVDNLIVLLGTGISGGDGVHSVETTLFQSFVEARGKYQLDLSSCLADSAGNGYYIPDVSCLRVFVGEQSSFRHDGKNPTRGKYAVAWLDHGVEPRDASYHYAIVVQGADSIQRLAATAEDYYRVVKQTNLLHHVEFPQQRLSGFVFFEPTDADHPVLSRANEPSVAMCHQLAEDRIQLGVVNPDIGLLPPNASAPTFKSIAEDPYRPSQPRTVEIALRGAWHPADIHEDVVVVSRSQEQTVVRFKTLHGMSVQAEFLRNPR
jgi:chondroitin-sulfate-ABC endolyase/exolyase